MAFTALYQISRYVYSISSQLNLQWMQINFLKLVSNVTKFLMLLTVVMIPAADYCNMNKYSKSVKAI